MDSRYSRQLLIPAFCDGQRRLARARVLVVGAGGLGCPVLLALAGAGVGTSAAGGWIRIVDPDVVDISNLHRQFLYTEADCGDTKVEAAARRLDLLNSDLAIDPHQRVFANEHAASLLEGVDLVLDCTDNLASRLDLNHWCYHLGLPLISAGISRYAGVLSCFNGQAPPCLACASRFSNFGADCAVDGIVGAVAQAFGSLMANQALQYLLGNRFGMQGMWLLDSKHMQATSIRVPPDPGCVVCSTRRQAPTQAGLEVDWHECKQNWLLVDIRERSDLDKDGIRHIPAALLRRDLYKELGDSKPAALVLLCNRGAQSLALARQLLADYRPQQMQIFSLRGGVKALLQRE